MKLKNSELQEKLRKAEEREKKVKIEQKSMEDQYTKCEMKIQDIERKMTEQAIQNSEKDEKIREQKEIIVSIQSAMDKSDGSEEKIVLLKESQRKTQASLETIKLEN